MTRVEAAKFHQCRIELENSNRNPTLLDRTSDTYQEIIQEFSQWLFRSGWTVSSLLVPSLFGEPIESAKSAFRRIFGWQSPWEKLGFFDVGNPNGLKRLKKTLKKSDSWNEGIPVLLFHGVFSTPDVWLPWGPTLQKAQVKNKIGHVIAIQLPNNLEERMRVVYDTINKIAKLYQKKGIEQVDIIGHSKGGYAGHLAAFLPDSIQIKDASDVERRWHSIDPQDRNPLVRKVISIAAPTWLCCQGQTDETTVRKSKNKDIYPEKIFTEKDIEAAYTTDQLKTLQDSQLHKDIYDIVATQDAISATLSPLPLDRVFYAKHRHLGITTCPKICKLAISILAA